MKKIFAFILFLISFSVLYSQSVWDRLNGQFEEWKNKWYAKYGYEYKATYSSGDYSFIGSIGVDLTPPPTKSYKVAGVEQKNFKT